jgi:hypothetical protein
LEGEHDPVVLEREPLRLLGVECTTKHIDAIATWM